MLKIPQEQFIFVEYSWHWLTNLVFIVDMVFQQKYLLKVPQKFDLSERYFITGSIDMTFENIERVNKTRPNNNINNNIF